LLEYEMIIPYICTLKLVVCRIGLLRGCEGTYNAPSQPSLNYCHVRRSLMWRGERTEEGLSLPFGKGSSLPREEKANISVVRDAFPYGPISKIPCSELYIFYLARNSFTQRANPSFFPRQTLSLSMPFIWVQSRNEEPTLPPPATDQSQPPLLRQWLVGRRRMKSPRCCACVELLLHPQCLCMPRHHRTVPDLMQPHNLCGMGAAANQKFSSPTDW
jgi:hypothetical protein